MKRPLCLLLSLLILTIALLSGCSQEEDLLEGDPALTFTDSTGYFVTAPNAPRTVAVLSPAYAEVWTLAGGTVRITTADTVDQGFASQDAILVDTGDGMTIDQEALLAARPDFVIGSSDIPAHVDACEAARKAGISAALFHVGSFQDYLRMLDIFTMITGDEAAYEAHGHQLQQRIDGSKAQVTIYGKILTLTVADGEPVACGPSDHFLCAALEDLGAQNVVACTTALEDLPPVSPDHIFLIYAGDEENAQLQTLLAQAEWSALPAVQQGNYTFLDGSQLPNARWPQTYETLVSILCPDSDT